MFGNTNLIICKILKCFDDFRTREERERDASYTRASILMVVVFVVCHTPRLITNTLELFVDQADLPLVSPAKDCDLHECKH